MKLDQLEAGLNAMLDEDDTTPMGNTWTERPAELNLNSEEGNENDDRSDNTRRD